MNKPADTEKQVLYPLTITANVQNDYWYVWIKCGLLDYLCLRLREKYGTPILREEDDRYFGEIINGDDSVSDGGHRFYDEWDKALEFAEELNGYLVQLNLGEVVFWEMFDRVFYDKPLDINFEWTNADTKSQSYLYGFPDDIDDFPAREFGRSNREVGKKIEKLKKLGRKYGVKRVSSLIDIFENYKTTIKSDVRQIQNRELYVEVIEQLRIYKTAQWVDYQDDEDNPNNKNLQQISEKCAARIVSKFDLENFTSLAFRRLVGRLYQSFPLLKEYISQSKS